MNALALLAGIAFAAPDPMAAAPSIVPPATPVPAAIEQGLPAVDPADLEAAASAASASTASAAPAPLTPSDVEPARPVAASTPAVVAPAVPLDARPPIQTSGYVQALYSNVRAQDPASGITTTPDGFSARRVRLKFKGELAPGAGYVVMVDPSTPQQLMKDAYLFLKVPRHEIRVGQQKTQFGFENPESSSRLLTVNRALVSDSLGRGRDLRDLGVGALGSWSLPGGAGIDYAGTVVNGAGPNAKDDTRRKSFFGRGGASVRTHGIAAHAGASFASGDWLLPGDPATPDDDQIAELVRNGFDARIDSPWAFVYAEAITGALHAGETRTRASGAFVTLVGKTPWSFGPLVRYEELDPDVKAPENTLRKTTLGVWLDADRLHSRLIVNYEIDRSDVRTTNAVLVMTQVQF